MLKSKNTRTHLHVEFIVWTFLQKMEKVAKIIKINPNGVRSKLLQAILSLLSRSAVWKLATCVCESFYIPMYSKVSSITLLDEFLFLYFRKSNKIPSYLCLFICFQGSFYRFACFYLVIIINKLIFALFILY